jgi:hypothetical protein
MSFGIVGKDREGIGSADTDGSWERPAELRVPRMRYCLPSSVYPDLLEHKTQLAADSCSLTPLRSHAKRCEAPARYPVLSVGWR